MSVWRYQVSARIEINAPIEYVYTFASDPKIVPTYAPEVVRIDEVKRHSAGDVLVRSHLKIAGLTKPFLYRIQYKPPTSYSGKQEGARFLRGYFNFVFGADGNRTTVSHTEGFTSTVPCLAWIAGYVYFHILMRRGVGDELERLKRLVESHAPSGPRRIDVNPSPREL